MSDKKARGSSTDDTDKAETIKQDAVAPPDTPSEIWTRRSILAAFWAVVLFLGFPYWLWTTSVYRAELDVASASRWINGEICDMKYQLNIRVSSPNHSRTTFIDQLQQILDAEAAVGAYRYNVAEAASKDDADLRINVVTSNDANGQAAFQSYGSTMVVQCQSVDGDAAQACARSAAEQILLVTSGEMSALAFLARDTPYADQLQYPQGDTTELERQANRAFKYASSYHLTFSLFTASFMPSSWEVEAALKEYVQPLLHSLSPISNFTIDTQVQYYASFSPSMLGPHYDDQRKVWQLSQADLSGFINAAEWPLNPSIDAGPTINFVTYIPSPEQSPLEVPGSATNSWIIPQWGGVQILNRPRSDSVSAAELETVMYTFADQLTALLGLPKQPASLQLRIKALTRQRTTSLIISASDTLGALIRLAEKLEQIAIPKSVAQAVSSAVADLELSCQSLQTGHHKAALLYARRADEAVEKAFFEPSMVGQVYFPDEHKVAVYVPLLGPMAVPLLMATIKEIKKWRQKKVKTS